MAGSLVFGYLGDKIGRKKVFFIAIILQIVAGLALIVVPHWTLFAFLRAAVGFAHPGIFVVAVVIGVCLRGDDLGAAAPTISVADGARRAEQEKNRECFHGCFFCSRPSGARPSCLLDS